MELLKNRENFSFSIEKLYGKVSSLPLVGRSTELRATFVCHLCYNFVCQPLITGRCLIFPLHAWGSGSPRSLNVSYIPEINICWSNIIRRTRANLQALPGNYGTALLNVTFWMISLVYFYASFSTSVTFLSSPLFPSERVVSWIMRRRYLRTIFSWWKK